MITHCPIPTGSSTHFPFSLQQKVLALNMMPSVAFQQVSSLRDSFDTLGITLERHLSH